MTDQAENNLIPFPQSEEANLLTHFDRAKRELELAASIDEVKKIRDQAEALRQYARQQKLSLEMQNRCAEIKIRAERRAGDILSEIEKHPPGPSKGDRSHDGTDPPRLVDLGISKNQSSRWQAIASIPEEEFDERVEEIKEKGEELTSKELLSLAWCLQRERERRKAAAKHFDKMIYFDDEEERNDQANKLFIGDCREILKEIRESGIKIQMAITSPPYFNMKNYLPEDHEYKGNEIGLEETPEEYVANLVEVFSLVRELLTDDGTFWLNIGDSYYNYRPGAGQALVKQTLSKTKRDLPDVCHRRGKRLEGLKEKDLLGIPWMTAFALRDSGWYLRAPIIWCKSASGQKTIEKQVFQACIDEGLDEDTAARIADKFDPYVGSCMPESVRDRPVRSFEDIFFLTKNQNYYYDARELEGVDDSHAYAGMANGRSPSAYNLKGRNLRSVWNITTRSYQGSHCAVFPPQLVEIPILACSREGDIILDPFFGSGTVGGVAEKLKRKWIGIELNPAYADLIPKRIEEIKNGK